MTEIDPSDLPLVLDQPHSIIENVSIDGTEAQDGCAFGIYVHADHCTVRNVLVRNMQRIGIGVRGVRQALIERAHVESAGMQGIWNERDCDGSTVRDSEVTDSGKDNIQIAGLNGTVDNCRVSGAGAGLPNFAGIYVAANSRGMSITKNKCSGNGTGIDVSWGFEADAQHNGGDMANGIVLIGNKCVQNNSCGIACASNGAILTANHCLDNGLVPVVIPSSGIGLVNANGCILTGNVMGNTREDRMQRTGLLFVVQGASANASHNCLVMCNHFENNADFTIKQWFAHRYSALDNIHGHVITNNFGIL